MSINPLYVVSCSFTQGELEGAKPASNQIKCRAKPCLARRAWNTPRVLALRREATIFVPQGGTKITTLFQAVEKSRRLFRQPEEAALRQPPFRSYNSSIFRGCQDKRRVFQTFHRSQSVMVASVPAPSCKGARQLDGREERCGRRMGGYCISVFHEKFTSFGLKSHIFCCELLTFWLFCSVI